MSNRKFTDIANYNNSLYYKNALAVYGVVPMISLCVWFYNNGYLEPANDCKNALQCLNSDERFRNICQQNRVSLNFNLPVSINDVDVLDLVFANYIETYNVKNLQSDMQGIIDFISFFNH